MLKSFVVAAESYRNATRPTIYDSVRAVLDFYGLDSTANIYYNGENEIAALVGSSMDNKPRSNIYTDGTFRNKLFIVGEIEPHDFNSGFGNAKRSMTEMPVWSDPELGMRLIPAFEGRKVNVEINGHFNSRQAAQAFVNKVNVMQASQVVNFNFNSNVHYPVNAGIIDLFSDIHRLLEKNDPTTKPMVEWFGERAKHAFTTITNIAGNNASLVTPFLLQEIGIQFVEARVRLANKASQTGSYEATMAYYFYYQEFVGWDIEYPLNVYQDEINEAFIPHTQPTFGQKVGQNTGTELALSLAFSQTITARRKGQTPWYLKLPSHDPWTYPSTSYIYPSVQARLRVEDGDTQELCNLFGIPDYEWNEKVKTYIKRIGNKVFFENESPFLVEVFSGDLRILPKQLQMDADGNITLTRPATLKNTHRLIVSLNVGIKSYSEDFWKDLQKNKEDWGILPPIFPWWKWDEKTPEEWFAEREKIINNIDLGVGEPVERFDRYESNLSVGVHLYKERLHGV